MADVLDRALEMSLDERKLRMNQLKKRERKMDVDAWVRGFLDGMDNILWSSEDKKLTFPPQCDQAFLPNKYIYVDLLSKCAKNVQL